MQRAREEELLQTLINKKQALGEDTAKADQQGDVAKQRVKRKAPEVQVKSNPRPRRRQVSMCTQAETFDIIVSCA